MDALAQRTLAKYGTKVGPKILKALMQYFSAPAATAASTGAATAATTGAFSAGDVGLAAGSTGAGAGASSGVGGVSAGGWASLAAPLIMSYMAYQAGSGMNEPLVKQMETKGSGKLIKDLLAGNKPDNTDYWSKYRLQPKYSRGWDLGADVPGWKPPETQDYGISELWHKMHSMGAGANQPGGKGSSGWSDAEIDAMLYGQGVNPDQLQKELGYSSMPTWENQNYGDFFIQNHGQEDAPKPMEVMPQEKRDEQDELRRLLYGG